ncbi:gp8 [Mycobacterium phage Barnyard]|uniref:Uncharacterized protein n=1 Tax=Mycobacterium phage Barnyard TaxID=205880 RepID=Q856G4_9CAUD|nr:gp8 [Mycobacterium phage Barnyard]AAN02062.1 hypothetical protein PBI_BARNYARD_8 [Mycobacterium phage Barnyard]
MARRARRKFKASLRMIGGRTVLITPGLRRVRRRSKRASSPTVDRMVQP